MPVIAQISSFLVILLIFALLLYGSYYFSKKVAGASMRGSQSKYMKVVDRIILGQDRCVAIICVGTRYYLIGSSGAGINMLTEIEEDNLTELPSPQGAFPGTPSFKEMMKRMGKDRDSGFKDTKL